MEVTFDIDLEKFRYSLVGDGYLLSELVEMSHEDLIEVLKRRVNSHISVEYNRSVKHNMLDKFKL